jgi:hypothetical protein
VSIEPIRKYDGAQTITSSRQNAKNQAREANLDAALANRSNGPTSDVTSDGICAVSVLSVTVLVIPNLLSAWASTSPPSCRPTQPVPKAPLP